MMKSSVSKPSAITSTTARRYLAMALLVILLSLRYIA